MKDFLAAIGLVFAIEGLLFAAFPHAVARAMREVAEHGERALRRDALAEERQRARGARLREPHGALVLGIPGVAEAAALPVPDGSLHRLPIYGPEAFAVEVEFFADWYVPHATGSTLAPEARAEFVAIWSDLIARLDGAERNWVLLDYHSPNLMWRSDRRDLERLGLLDFQDAVMGPAAYDVA